ncbi:MAG: hypothetical protein WBP29_03940 [Candidatus Zixiibacteriota bacterium]
MGYITRMSDGKKDLFDSILAVLGGYFAIYIITKTALTILAVSTGAATNRLGALPDTKYLLIILASAFVSAMIGAVIACLIAKTAPLKHTIALAAVALILGVMTTVSGSEPRPVWYSISLIGLSVIGILLVGLIMQVRQRSKASRL